MTTKIHHSETKPVLNKNYFQCHYFLLVLTPWIRIQTSKWAKFNVFGSTKLPLSNPKAMHGQTLSLERRRRTRPLVRIPYSKKNKIQLINTQNSLLQLKTPIGAGVARKCESGSRFVCELKILVYS